MSEFDFIETEVPEGLLKIDLDSMTPQQQFDSWMLLKNVVFNQKVIISNIVQNNILNKEDGTQSPYDRCFGKDSFSRGGGYDKSSFDKICINENE